ncbi:hypothetical protein ACYZTX_28975 [Pseudomonas sp. MDT1-17]
MPHMHQGPAHVTLYAGHSGLEALDILNEAVSITLTASALLDVACLAFAQPLFGPARPHYVRVMLPSGLAVAGPIVQRKYQPDGSGWLTFEVEETNLGWT